jgi:hypothetical protein
MIEYVTMTAAEVENILQNAYKHKLNVLLIGTHGVGKTMSCLSILKKQGVNYKHFSVPTMDPWVDLTGLPKPVGDDDNLKIKFARPELDVEGVEVLLFDEINRGHPKTMDALFEITQFRTCNGKVFKNLKMVWATMNPPGKGSMSNALDPALEDRFDIKIQIAPQINKNYFGEKYGVTFAENIYNWYSVLPPDIKLELSPRRIEKAIDCHKLGIPANVVVGDQYAKGLVDTLGVMQVKNEESDLFTTKFSKYKLAFDAFSNAQTYDALCEISARKYKYKGTIAAAMSDMIGEMNAEVSSGLDFSSILNVMFDVLNKCDTTFKNRPRRPVKRGSGKQPKPTMRITKNVAPLLRKLPADFCSNLSMMSYI